MMCGPSPGVATGDPACACSTGGASNAGGEQRGGSAEKASPARGARPPESVGALLPGFRVL
eukprot:841045-Prymnesium_polylepis.1